MEEESNNNNEPPPAPKKRPFYGRLPKRRKRFGHHVEHGGKQKTSTTYAAYKDSGAVNNVVNPSAVTSTTAPEKPKKPTNAELTRQVGYLKRDKSLSNEKVDKLKSKSVHDNELHQLEMVAMDSKLYAKTEECKGLAALAQTRRREASISTQQAEVKVAAAEDNAKSVLKAAERSVDEAQAAARKTVHAERRHTASLLSTKEAACQKRIGCLTRAHDEVVKQKDDKISKVLEEKKKLRELVNTANAEVVRIKKLSREDFDALKVQYKDMFKSQKIKHAEDIQKKKNEITKLQNDNDELLRMMSEVADDADNKAYAERVATKRAESSSILADQRLKKFKDYRDKYRVLKDELVEAQEENAEMAEKIKEYELSVNEMTQNYEETIHNLTPQLFEKTWVKNKGKRGGQMQWLPHVDKLIIEMLSNRTPPSCIQKNILAMARVIFPNQDIVRELPSLRHIRNLNTSLLLVTKTLAAFQYASATAKQIRQVHADATSRRQEELLCFIVAIEKDDVLRSLCMSCSIMARDKSAASQVEAIMASFPEFRRLLDNWRAALVELYPTRVDLHALIPPSNEVSVAKLNGTTITTDTCNVATSFRRQWKDEITRYCRDEMKMTQDSINDLGKILDGDCWQHMRNIIFNGIEIEMKKYLTDLLEEDIANIPSIYRVDFGLGNNSRCVDKEWGITCNYAKGHGSSFIRWMHTERSGELLMPIVRALGGTRQDGPFEAALPTYMNRHYYVGFLDYYLKGSDKENILQYNLFLTLRCNEMTAQLRVAAILHVAIVIPMRWLAGKTHELAKYNWGERSMSRVLDLVYDVFVELEADGSKGVDADYMLNIFSSIGDEVEPFKKYLEYMFEEKESNVVDSKRRETRVLSMDLAVAELFWPTRVENRQTTPMCKTLFERAGSRAMAECIDPTKQLHHHLSEIHGAKSWVEVSEEDKKASLGIRANNDPAESAFAVYSDSFEQGQTIRQDNAAGKGQSRFNKDFFRAELKSLVTGKKSIEEDDENHDANVSGTWHSLCEELQNALILASKRDSARERNKFDEALEQQRIAREEVLDNKRQKDLAKTEESYIDATYLWQQYHSERCAKTPKDAWDAYNACTSETGKKGKLPYVKEQIHMRYLGLGWAEAYHAYSKDGYKYKSIELMEHFVKTVLPLADTLEVPDQPALELPTLSEKLTSMKLGTVSLDFEALSTMEEDTETKFRKDALIKRRELQDEGKGDELEQMQTYHWPEEKLKNYSEDMRDEDRFKIDMLFHRADDTNVWAQGTIIKVFRINKNEAVVNIKWNEEHVEGDEVTKEKLLRSKWNPDKPGSRAWREELRHKIWQIE